MVQQSRNPGNPTDNLNARFLVPVANGEESSQGGRPRTTRPDSLVAAHRHGFTRVMNDGVRIFFRRHAQAVLGCNKDNPEGAFRQYAGK